MGRRRGILTELTELRDWEAEREVECHGSLSHGFLKVGNLRKPRNPIRPKKIGFLG
jgi:hypothetical protein